MTGDDDDSEDDSDDSDDSEDESSEEDEQDYDRGEEDEESTLLDRAVFIWNDTCHRRSYALYHAF